MKTFLSLLFTSVFVEKHYKRIPWRTWAFMLACFTFSAFAFIWGPSLMMQALSSDVVAANAPHIGMSISRFEEICPEMDGDRYTEIDGPRGKTEVIFRKSTYARVDKNCYGVYTFDNNILRDVSRTTFGSAR